MNTTENYFASANTTEGFKSFFSVIFDPEKLKKILIIKGGPGTGKSHLMKKAALWGEKKGWKTKRFSCSSDPDSLDAVLFPEQGLALLDGTSPHSFEARFPGAVEEIFDAGAYWNQSVLEEKRDEICLLTKKKTDAYRCADLYFSAAGNFYRRALAVIHPYFLYEKAEKAIDRLLSHFPGEGDEKRSVCFNESFNHFGFNRSLSFEKEALSGYSIRDEKHSAYLFLNLLEKKLAAKKIARTIGFSAFDPQNVSGIYLENEKKYFTIDCGAKLPENGKTINMLRFLSPEYQTEKKKVKYLFRCADFLALEAQKSYAEAREAHLLLEAVYTPAMDFKGLNAAFRKKMREYGL